LSDTYLAHVGIEGSFDRTEVPCEVCGTSSSTLIRETADIGRGKRARLPVVACDRCGFLFQNPRFPRAFYDAYYARQYRPLTSGGRRPSRGFIEDQIERGRILCESLAPHLGPPGRLLDVGCSSGGMMIAFLERGWTACGVDPDEGYVEYGREVLKLPVEACSAEDMELPESHYDLIIITGSLEHVYDPNRVLSLCRAAAAPESQLQLEGRGLAQVRQTGTCGHNHRRYLTANSAELLMLKHGWQPFWTTHEELSGPTRPESVYCLGRAAAPVGRDELLRLIDGGMRESPEVIRNDFDAWGIA
jgi:SAM-dependent methyltransferase